MVKEKRRLEIWANSRREAPHEFLIHLKSQAGVPDLQSSLKCWLILFPSIHGSISFNTICMTKTSKASCPPSRSFSCKRDSKCKAVHCGDPWSPHGTDMTMVRAMELLERMAAIFNLLLFLPLQPPPKKKKKRLVQSPNPSTSESDLIW